MSLWVDKYRPTNLSNLSHNESLKHQLEQLAQNNPHDLPHLLFYGPNGAGKKTRAMCLLNSIFDSSIYKLKIDVRQFQVNSRKLELNVVSSPHHIEITPSDLGGSYDRVVIQELLKEVGQTEQVEFGQAANSVAKDGISHQSPKFKVVIINDANSLSRDAQSALRRTMEKYSKNLRLIMLCDSLSSIISPIKSRVLLIRTPTPTMIENMGILQNVCVKEKVSVESKDILEKIVDYSNGNLRVSLLCLETMALSNDLRLKDNTALVKPDWKVVISKMGTRIIKERSVSSLIECRSTLYDLLAHCIPADTIMHELTLDLLEKLSENSNDTLKLKVVSWASVFDERLALGSKAIYHLEGFIARVMWELDASRV